MGQKNRFFSLFSRNRKDAASGEDREEKRREPEEKKKFRLKDLDPDEGYLKEEPDETKNKPSDTMSDLIETVEDWNDTEKKRELGTEDTSGSPPSAGNNAPADTNPAESDQNAEVEPKDAFAEIAVAEDKMSASILVNSPVGGGRDITLEEIRDMLDQMGIEYGIDEDKLKDIVENELYNQVFQFAEGTPAIDGTNGKIKDYFPRHKEVKFASKENDSIDFKSTNYIHNVKAGELVCELTPPEPPQDGVDIFGNTVYGKPGIMPPIPQGKNVVYNEEKDKLLTGCEGNLSFRSGRFHVEKILNIGGNVDNSVGNIDFTGSVSIKGDVLEGFTVKAKGDITVMGIVEGATLISGGSIILYKGMRGMKSGVLEAAGDITAKFLEDSKIYARGDIQAEYIINSEVSCGNNLTLTGRRAAFIGGVCSVYNTMNVKTVGAMSQITTLVTLGVTPQLLGEVENLKKDIADITAQLDECKKNITYLNTRQKAGTISPKQTEKLNELKIWLPVNTMKQKKMKDQMQKLTLQLKEVKKSRLTAREVFGGTIISIGDSRLVISRKEENCSYYYMDGQIKRGLR
ncbi:FapA family protein [[Clostridium] symbiosum]|uniref:DUF342 domain-containing protein n=1 Tax=Clostridium symbiosum TaxID=1512 RepID=UPI001D07631A|nr:FapA family protein [[Clostridium] symbiosum]MCB6609791.1 FapA family protein [[Clostridium] symbiosum]MCB6931253.1 FapA family protein [[Clostridium] symbiosum]